MDNVVFQVGLTLSVEAYYKTHLNTQILGSDKDAFVLTKAIYIQGLPSKIKTNDHCKIRFLKDGVAYGFETDVIAVQFFPFPLMFLKYPENIERLKLRVAPRFKANMPAKFLHATEAYISEAFILDISEGGCGMQVPVQEGFDLLPDAGYIVAFKLLDRDVAIRCYIKKMNKGPETYFLGVKFNNITPQNQETLTTFLDFLKKHTGE